MAQPRVEPGLTGPPPLLIDLYELTMGASYLAEGLAERSATFEVSCRRLPPGWGYLLAVGIEELVDRLETFGFDGAMLSFLETTGLFGGAFLDLLERFRFRGDVRALPEGTVFFAGEPLVEVTAPLLDAQLVETTVLNGLGFPSLVASKAARCVDAAEGRTLVDFSLRRTHGADAGLRVARGSYLAGFDSTSNVLAGAVYGIPVSGTMAHSYVEAFGDESAAFEAFARAQPDGTTLLIDTYGTLEGARRAALLAHGLRGRGGRLGGVRIDSGDLAKLSRQVRALLDEAGLPEVSIFATGDLDEHELSRLLTTGARIDGFGVGTRLGVSADAPSLDIIYKLVCVDGRPVMKLSPGKRTLPGSKQVWRRSDRGQFVGDTLALASEHLPSSEPLLHTVMEHGARVRSQTLHQARERAASQRSALPPDQRRLDPAAYPVLISDTLADLGRRLADELASTDTPVATPPPRPRS